MSGNSLADLLAWLKVKSRLQGWGMIYAFEKDKINRLIEQEYIRRFNMGNDIAPVKGDVPVVENIWKVSLSNWLLRSPQMSFENTGLNDSRARLSMAVMGGKTVSLNKVNDSWKANKIEEYDPLQGPKLFLELLLHQVIGNVSGDGLISLDLKKSDNFILESSDTLIQREIVGEYFKTLFTELPDEKRIYPLGRIRHGSNQLMNPTSFHLRTQSGADVVVNPQYKGCILVFIATATRKGDGFPGEGFKYLIPDDAGKDYSATLLFEPSAVSASVLIFEVAKLLGISAETDFKYSHNADGELLTATATSGKISLPAINTDVHVDLQDGSKILVNLDLNELIFPSFAPSALVIDVSQNKYTVQWSVATKTRCKLSSQGQVPYEKMIACSLKMSAEYELDDSAAGVSLRRTDLQVDTAAEFLDEKAHKQDKGTNQAEFWDTIKLYFILSTVKADILDKKLGDLLEEALKGLFKADFLVKDLIDEVIEMHVGQTVQGGETHAPWDIGYFGRINPTQTTFVINPTDLILGQDGTHQFATDPVVTGVKWAVEPLVKSADSPGTISESGLYHAPKANSFSGRFTRLRITASDPRTGYFSQALVTVVAKNLTINPRIQTCDRTNTVELRAGSLGNAPQKWSIKNPVAGSGTVSPISGQYGAYTYRPGSEVPDQTFLLEEIEVQVGTEPAQSVHVLVLQKQPAAFVEIVSTDPGKGQVQLQAVINGRVVPVVWRLPLGGPGTIDANGLYQAPANPVASFVLIYAVYENEFLGNFEGFRILPLPLDEFPELLEVLEQ
ncbi:hypothetical protein [Pseudomonas izuensis]|uniref:Uncharacterized protein n=1 Tax=Pseudomonas izuensis TaxID=2684212 RepID=A0ABM7RRP6_9PSED|nr:hypothetical protein [Pseudomonas izuensis]BCX68056.1 hypothetical protein LAB08_R26960 [Pseudomonas izuensis]